MSRTGNMCLPAIIALLLSGIFAFAGSAHAQGELAPDKASSTLRSYRFRCKIVVLCPYSEEVWDTFQAAVAGKPGDEYLLGVFLITGDKVGRDEHGGLQWLAVAASQGYATAALELNRQRRNGAEMDVDEARIAAAMRTKANAGDADAMRALSDMYIFGRGVGRDPNQGVQLLRNAAESGSHEAEEDLATLMWRGAPGVAQDHAEAIRWQARSAGHGNTEAMRILSYWLLDTMSGGKAQPLDSYRWLMRAALLDDPDAQEKLSQLFTAGLDIEGRPIRTAYGDLGGRLARAQTVLIAPDLVQADKWFRLASRNPWHDNPQVRASIEPHMTTAQLDEAKKLAASWHVLPLPEVLAIDIEPPPVTAERSSQYR
jgi:TPR repeat protein